MTKEEIIEMVREALTQKPREDWNSNAWVFSDETLQAFAKLVAEKEREACAKVCEDYGRDEEMQAIGNAYAQAITVVRYLSYTFPQQNNKKTTGENNLS